MKKRILVTGCGGTPSTNFIRSLAESPEDFYIIGVDLNEYYLQRSEAHERYLCPPANHPKYIDFINYIIQKTKADLVYMQPDQEIFQISKHRDEIRTRVCLPSHRTIEICQDKFLSFQAWKNAGLLVPETIIVNTVDDLKDAFDKFGSIIWIREIISPGGGKGSFKATNIDIAKAWIDYYNGWGNFTAAECLDTQSITWQSIWKNGRLVIAQGRKRLYWEFGNRAPSGVTGLTGAGVTVSDTMLDEIAQRAIFAIDPKPHGIFSVDLTYDQNGNPNLTEINIGRFFTTHWFFTKAGLNMPYLFVKTAFNEPIPKIKKKINPLPNNLVWIRGLDFMPVLTTTDSINTDKKNYEDIMRLL